jgi:uncharacterized cupin superfamily protein
MSKPAIARYSSAATLEKWPDYPEEEIAAGSRGQSGHMYFEDGKSGLSTGVWQAEASTTRWMEYPVHEFMMILEGKVTIETERGNLSVKAGESFVIPKGLRLRWIQKQRVKKFFVIFEGGEPAPKRGAIKIDPGAMLEPSPPPSADMLLSPVPTQHSRDVFTDPSGRFNVGVWDTTGYRRRQIDFPRHELMHLLEGSVTFTDDAGLNQTFTKGDTFFVPLGTPNAWKSEGYLRKIFCIVQPEA